MNLTCSLHIERQLSARAERFFRRHANTTRSWILTLCLASILALPKSTEASTPDSASIQEVRAVGQDLVVTVRVPAGKRRVTLETRSRLSRGAWTPRKVQWTDGNEDRELRFVLPLGDGMEMVRVREETESELGLPAKFFTGPKTFSPTREVESTTASPGILANGLLTFSPTNPQFEIALDTKANAIRSVVESDIWKLDGRTLYFFNQQRGLQVLDLTDTDHPVLTGTLPLAVWGEQMYRLPAQTSDGSTWLALLAQQGCRDNQSEVLIVNVKSGRPNLTRRLPVAGQIRETRLVGDALYLASYDWFQPPPREVRDADGNVIRHEESPWESRTIVSAFDLTDPAQPEVRPSIELPVNPDAIVATDRLLFVATTGTRTPRDNERLPSWAVAGQHAVILFDLSEPHGAVRQAGFLLTAGRVGDKFKMGLLGKDGEALGVISQVDAINRPVTRTNPSDGTVTTTWEIEPSRTVLETFSLADPAAPSALSQLPLVTNESVFATRFAGERVYVVTFRRVDPLWIVDLSDPAHPVIQGELSIPGYSTYLQPLADNTRLLALGVEQGRTIVQLFDVADATHPTLMSKVALGEGWSWSEGNSDEKAFQVFPESSLALVPWQGQRSGAQPQSWFQGIQLIDFNLEAGTLKARGVIDHAVQARRATLVGDRIISVSSQELVTVDAVDRDHPRTVAELPLSTQIDRVWVHGDQLIELRNAGTTPAQIALAPSTAPEQPVASLALDSLAVIGADLRGDQLFVLQFRSDEWRNETVTVRRPIVKEVPQPPVSKFHTNFVVREIPPPLVDLQVTNVVLREESWGPPPVTTITVQTRRVPLPLATNLATTVITRDYPMLPGDTGPRSYTLTWIRPEFTPQPSTFETNKVVTVEQIPQPPLQVTEWIEETVSQPVRVPGELRLSVVEVGSDALRQIGQTNFDVPAEFNGGPLTALWPQPDTVVWTQRAEGQSWGGVWFGLWQPTILRPVAIDPVFPRGDFSVGISVPWIGWGPGFTPWWGYSVRDFLAFQVSDVGQPMLASHTRLGGTNAWNGFSATWTADGKLFLSHRTSQYLASPEKATVITNADGTTSLQPLWQPGTWEHRHYLDVLDFADAAHPVVRTPLELPGTLSGISHEGMLVYATGTSATTTAGQPDAQQLHALAYDGVQVSWVSSLPLPYPGSQPLVVRNDGRIWLSRPAASSQDTPALETWGVSIDGRFERYGTRPVPMDVEALHPFGDLLVTASSDQFQFFDATDPDALVSFGATDRPCTLSLDWPNADASPTTGLWLPRNAQGIWNVPVTR